MQSDRSVTVQQAEIKQLNQTEQQIQTQQNYQIQTQQNYQIQNQDQLQSPTTNQIQSEQQNYPIYLGANWVYTDIDVPENQPNLYYNKCRSRCRDLFVTCFLAILVYRFNNTFDLNVETQSTIASCYFKKRNKYPKNEENKELYQPETRSSCLHELKGCRMLTNEEIYKELLSKAYTFKFHFIHGGSYTRYSLEDSYNTWTYSLDPFDGTFIIVDSLGESIYLYTNGEMIISQPFYFEELKIEINKKVCTKCTEGTNKNKKSGLFNYNYIRR
jgi:hypothetical protein